MSHDVTVKPSAREIFEVALPLTDPAERRREVGRLCGGDEALRRKVERLLAGHASADESPLDRIARDFGPEETVLSAAAAATTLNLATHPQIGPYKLLKQIGEGGMGVVYVAEQTEPVRRRVALKIVKPGMDTRRSGAGGRASPCIAGVSVSSGKPLAISDCGWRKSQ